MASTRPAPANAVEPNRAGVDDDAFRHITPDADGSLAFNSREEAERFTQEKGVASSWSDTVDGQQVENSNLVPIGTTWVILDPNQKAKARSAPTGDSPPKRTSARKRS